MSAAEFVLTSPSEPIGPDNQLVIGFILTNLFERDMYFNTRFAVAPTIGDIWPTLIAPSGIAVPFALRVRLAPLLSSDFLALKPNQTVMAGTVLQVVPNQRAGRLQAFSEIRLARSASGAGYETDLRWRGRSQTDNLHALTASLIQC